MSRTKIGVGFLAVGVILICAAALMIFRNNLEDSRAGASAAAVLQQLQQQMPEQPATEWFSDSPVSVTQREMSVIEIDGYDYIGYLSLPTLELELPVMSAWDEDRLRIAPCRYSGATFTHDLVIAAHNYRNHFGRLRRLTIGDPVLFTDADGVTTVYEVRGLEMLKPNQVEEMKNSPWDLSLYTCTMDREYRITIRCAQVSQSER